MNYRTPGVYIEEISNGPRPVQASSTTETGFVAVIEIPTQFIPGGGGAAGMYLPGSTEDVHMSWNRARAFRRLAPAIDAPAASDKKAKGKKETPAAAGNEFQQLISEVLPGQWDVKSPTGDSKVTMASAKGEMLRFPVSRALMSVTVDAASKAEWDLSFTEASNKVMELIATHAEDQGVAHTGELGCVDKTQKPITIDVDAIHDRMHGTAPSFSSMDGFHAWRSEWSANLFV